MSSDRGKLGNFLNEVIDWRWDDFCRAEKDPDYTGYQASVFALVRTCSDAKLSAIKLAIDRIDGKLVTPIKVEYPKIFFLYPHAETVAALPAGAADEFAAPSLETLPEVVPEAQPEEAETMATLSLRQMVAKMADQPAKVVPLILAIKRRVELTLADNKEVEENEFIENKVPSVKAVIAANLLHLANEKHNFEAINEIFDQIDGKLVETIKILADDVYLIQYALEAPFGAVKNKDGIYMLEAKEIAASWKEKLKKD